MHTWIASQMLSQDIKVSSNSISSNLRFIRNSITMKHIYQDTQALPNIGAVHSDKHIHII